MTFALAIATFSCGYAAANAVWPSFYGEMFSTKVRFSRLAIGTQVGFLMAGIAPTIVTASGGVETGGWVVSAIFTGIISAIAIGAALTARENKDVPTAELGPRPDKAARRSELISNGAWARVRGGDRERGSPSSRGIQDTDPVSDLFWPGDERASSLFSDAGLLRTMEAVEAAWLEALVAVG